MMEVKNEDRKNLYGAITLLVLILSVFFIIKIVLQFTDKGSLGMGEIRTITLSGHGEVQAVPDIANIYFSITKEAKTAKEAQDAVAKIENDAILSLTENKVESKDIKTENASFNPKYEWQSEVGMRLPCNEWGCPPSYGKSVIVGYEASESITVKVRNIDDVGVIMQDLGTVEVTNLSGPDFSIDDEDALKTEARRLAIMEAKEKAGVLADDLGVRLGKITSFSEGAGGFYPVFGKEMLMSADGASSTPRAQLPTGEQTINSAVTITYEIK